MTLDNKSKLQRLHNLPSLPKSVQQLCALLSQPDVSAAEVGSAIARDPVVSAKLLRIVNSPFYGFPRSIGTITHATVLLGFNVIRGILLCTSLFDNAASGVSKLWNHSTACATVAGIIARKARLEEPDEIAVAGLLHDIGKVVIAARLSTDFAQIGELARAENLFSFEAEKKHLDVTHTEIAGWMADQWNLPPRISSAMIYHHAPAEAKDAPQSAACVHIADALVKALGVDDGVTDLVPPIDGSAWQRLRISSSLLEEILDEAEPLLANLDQ